MSIPCASDRTVRVERVLLAMPDRESRLVQHDVVDEVGARRARPRHRPVDEDRAPSASLPRFPSFQSPCRNAWRSRERVEERPWLQRRGAERRGSGDRCGSRAHPSAATSTTGAGRPRRLELERSGGEEEVAVRERDEPHVVTPPPGGGMARRHVLEEPEVLRERDRPSPDGTRSPATSRISTAVPSSPRPRRARGRCTRARGRRGPPPTRPRAARRGRRSGA